MDCHCNGGRDGHYEISPIFPVSTGQRDAQIRGVPGPYASLCHDGASCVNWPFGLPEFIASAAVAALHAWKKNSLLSIGAGTVLYMVLVQLVF